MEGPEIGGEGGAKVRRYCIGNTVELPDVADVELRYLLSCGGIVARNVGSHFCRAVNSQKYCIVSLRFGEASDEGHRE